jgi:gamma-glutamyltranspeptidase/glutathione hydrolase
MNNQMDDFSTQPGVANYFGLVGAEANCVEPGKRPLSSMTPTIVLKGNRPVISLGAAGGPRIISAVLQELVCLLDLGWTPEQAVAAPRLHHQWSPDRLLLESAMPERLRSGLMQRGHAIDFEAAISTSQIIRQDPKTRVFTGAADPRVGGVALAW